jgi:hypothetical protein
MEFTMERHMTRPIIRTAIALMFAGLSVVPADAQTATGQLAASINNAGLQQTVDLTWRRERRAFGGTVAATPAGARLGGWIELTPVRFFVVKAGAEAGQYFGAFHSLTSFDSRLDPFDADTRRARDSAQSGRTYKLYFTPSLQARTGRFAARSIASFERWSSTAAGPFFYEPTRDTLLAVDGDDIASLTTLVLYQHPLRGGGQFSTGPIHSIVRTHRSSLNKIQKLGVVAVHQMSGRHFGISRPIISAQAAYYLDDPAKEGQWSATVAIGFSIGRARQ